MKLTKLPLLLIVFFVATSAYSQHDFNTYFLKDSTNRQTIHDVYSKKFKRIDPAELIFGVTKATYWVKVEIEEMPDNSFILSVDRPLLDTLKISYLNKDSTWVHNTFGIRHAAPEQGVLNPMPAIEIESENLLNNQVFLKAKSSYALLLPIKISETQSFFIESQQYDFFAALLLGALVVMMFYNLFLWISVKENTYLIYFFAILFTIIIQSSVQGYSFLIFPGDFLLPYYFVSIGIGINVILSVWFCMALLEVRNFSKWMKVGCYIIMSLGGLIFILELLSYNHFAKTIVVMSTSLGSLLLLTIGGSLWYRRVPAAKFFTIAWAIYLVGILVYGLRTEGILSHNFFTSNFAHIGKFCEVLLLSFAVGFKFNTVKKEKEQLQQQLNSELEFLVRERTLALNKALADKDVLIKEVHHRVKNNLQIISSILNMQSRQLIDEEAQKAVNEGKSRIRTMSLIHEKLYKSDKISRVVMLEYIEELSSYIFASYKKTQNVKTEIKAEKIILDIDTAIPIGLILNELITNSLKYAFEGREEGTITISLTSKGNKYQLDFSDNGTGLPVGYDKVKSMGMRLIRALVGQLGGELMIKQENGASFTVIFG